ncbi:MAG: M48 family metalloprotease, partial [Deltaproteobacteria bacterium]|nr:M48 family metalloprotease [Deltaproteobacteria bacterium]
MFKIVDQPEVQQYIDGVGRKILSVMGPQPFEYKFYVVQDSQLNAFAVPGGSIYIHTGIIENARTTDEVASVVSHEIIHVKGRHIARMSGLDMTSLIGMIGGLASVAGGGAGAAGIMGKAFAAQRQLEFTRQIEQEADTLGVKYMTEAGYDPRGSLSFFQTLARERAFNPVNAPPYLLTHPLTGDRIASVEIAIRSLNLRSVSSSRPDPLVRVQAILRL